MKDNIYIKKNRRIKWIDVAKGITILLVVLQHISTSYIRRSGNFAIINNNVIFRVISLIDMPIFFFLSGLFIDHLFKRSFLTILTERFKRLMIPYFIWGIISVIFLDIYRHNLSLVKIFELPIKPIFVLWFIYSLFIIDIMLYLLQKLFNHKAIILIILFIIYIIGDIWSNNVNIPIASFSRVIQGVLLGSLFVYLGYIYKKIIHLNISSKSRNYVFLSLVLIIILCIICYVKNPLTLIIGQILGVLLVICISKLLSHVKLLRYVLTNIGFITMQVYVIHKFIVEVCSFLIYKINTNLFIFTIINLLITIIVCYMIVIVINKMHLSRLMFGAKN